MTTMTAPCPNVTGGVDTHRDIHVAAALDQVGGVLGTATFPTTSASYRQLLGWLSCFGEVGKVGWNAPAAMGPRWPVTSPVATSR